MEASVDAQVEIAFVVEVEDAFIITPNYGGFKKRTGLNFGGYTESNSTSRIKLRVR
jgi:hypothetical protein